MIRVLIVDDEKLARRGVREGLRRATDVTVIGECSSGQGAIESIVQLQPDLLFLDIQMPDMNGFEVLSRVADDADPVVIFLTASDEFALDAFKIHALDYLLKPIEDARFASALNAARERLAQRHAQQLVSEMNELMQSRDSGKKHTYAERLAVKVGARTVLVPVKKIRWISAGGDYVTLHSAKKTYLIRETMARLEKKLDPVKFRRIHRSAIVSAEEVIEYRSLNSRDMMVRLRDGTEIRASRRYRNNVRS